MKRVLLAIAVAGWGSPARAQPILSRQGGIAAPASRGTAPAYSITPDGTASFSKITGDGSALLLGNGLTGQQLSSQVSAAATSAALAMATDGSKPMTGPLAVPQVNIGNGSGSGSIFFWNGAYGAHDFEGSASASNSAIYAQPYLYGHSSAGDLYHLWAGDGLKENTPIGFTMLNVYDNVSTQATGNREAIAGTIIYGKTPTIASAWEGVFAQTQVLAPLPNPAGFGWPAAIGDTTSGTNETGWDYNRVNNGANGLFLSYGREINTAYEPNVGVGENIGLSVVDLSPANNLAWGNGYPGLFTNIGYELNGGAYRCGFCLGKETGDWVLNPTMTMFGALNRSVGGQPSIAAVARYGMDLRPVGFTGGSLALPGMGVDGSGNASALSLTTGGSISAQTAGLAGAKIDFPGTYATWPGFTVQAPPMTGTTATVQVTSLSANSVLNFGSTGQNYAKGDSVTLSGLTGTSPSYQVTSVDAAGAITGLSLTGNGAVTDIASNAAGAYPIAALSGGSGSGGMLFVIWSSSADNKTLLPYDFRFAATGSGYAVGDTVTVAGDTGTAASFKVTAASPQGGIMMPVALASGGTQTALAGGTFHKATTSGAGANAALQIGYGVAAVTTTPGSGYLPAPLPIITATQSDWGNASLLPVMSATTAPLVLNAGNKIYLDATGQLWIQEIAGKVVIGTQSTRLMSLDQNGNLTVKGSIAQNGSP